MTEYIARCFVTSSDIIRVEAAETELSFEASTLDVICLKPDKAREFARGILTLADEVDPPARTKLTDVPRVADPVDEECETIWEGDTVRVLKDCANMADVKAGDTFKVKEVFANIGFDVYAPDRKDAGKWFFTPENVVKVEDDEYRWFVPLSAVERAADEPAETAPAFVNPERHAILTEAQSLVGSRDVPQLLDVARFLAGDPR